MEFVMNVNVGGIMYQTTFDTLSKSPYFAQRIVNQTYIFVDRDGWIFSHILCFLRTGKVFIPRTEVSLIEYLKCDADFYQLPLMTVELENL
jgi:hypothetical protein